MADDMIHLGHGSQHLKLDQTDGKGGATGVNGVSTRTLVGLRVEALSANGRFAFIRYQEFWGRRHVRHFMTDFPSAGFAVSHTLSKN